MEGTLPTDLIECWHGSPLHICQDDTCSKGGMSHLSEKIGY